MKSKIKHVLTSIINIFNLDKIILLMVIALCSINMIIQYSATDKDMDKLFHDYFYISIAFIVMIIIANINLNHIKSFAPHFYILSVILLFGVAFFGINVNGAKRWISIGFRIQPSEITKLSIPLMLAYYFSLKNTLTKLDFIKASLLLLIPSVLIIKQPDLGTGILVLCAGFYVLFFAGLSWKFIIISTLSLILSSPVIWYFLHPYQQNRILTLINSQSDPLGTGYHIIQGMIAIGSGGLWGKGYLLGTQTHLNFIPEKHTDFIITVLAEEFGFIGVCSVLLIYFTLIIRGLIIMYQSTNIFNRTLAGSITMSLMTYVFINMGMVSGILPVVGVPLPLISYGGTASIIIMASIGILLAIAKNNKTIS